MDQFPSTESTSSSLYTLPKWSFWLLAVLTLVLHVQVFQTFNTVYIDSDQPMLWITAADYAKGQFHEPRFYGQAYNTAMESLLALPFMWLKIPVYEALPLATHFIVLFPLLFMGFYLYAKKRYWNATLVLALNLCFSGSYDLLSSLPRGFVTGIFFAGFFLPGLLKPNKLSLVFVNSSLAVLAYFINPNSLLVTAPALFYQLLCNYRKAPYYPVALAGCLTYVPFYFIFDYFYSLHPEYIVHRVDFETNLELFLDSFKSLDKRFAHVSLFLQDNCLPLLLLLLCITLYTWFTDKKIFGAFLVFLFVLLVSFSNLRTTDGSNWIFFSQSRMYLGIPMSLSLLLSIKEIRLTQKHLVFVLIPLAFGVYKIQSLKETITENVKLYHWEKVISLPLQETLHTLKDINTICKKNNIPIVMVSGSYWLKFPLCYGAPAVVKDFPGTELMGEDRRYWVRTTNASTVYTRFLLLSGRSGIEQLATKELGFNLKSLDGAGIYLVTENTVPKIKFFEIWRNLETRVSEQP